MKQLKILDVFILKLFGIIYVPFFKQIKSHNFDYLFPIPVLMCYTYFAIIGTINFSNIEYDNMNNIIKVLDVIYSVAAVASSYTNWLNLFIYRDNIMKLYPMNYVNYDKNNFIIGFLFVLVLILDILGKLYNNSIMVEYYLMYNTAVYLDMLIIYTINRISFNLKQNYRSINNKLIRLDRNTNVIDIIKIMKNEKYELNQLLTKQFFKSFTIPTLSILCFNFIAVTQNIYYIYSSLTKHLYINELLYNVTCISLIIITQFYFILKPWISLQEEVSCN